MERPHGSVTVIMLGAATNFAAALQTEPSIASRLAQVQFTVPVLVLVWVCLLRLCLCVGL